MQIVVVHIQPERALFNVLHRFETEGRGATIEAMASIQGHLPDGLNVIQAHFGHAAQLHIIDRRATIVRETRGWEHVSELRSEGTYEYIKEHLADIIEREHQAGRIVQAAYDQAIGRAPERFYRSMAQESGGSLQRSKNTVSESLVDESHATRKRSGPEKANSPDFGWDPF